MNIKCVIEPKDILSISNNDKHIFIEIEPLGGYINDVSMTPETARKLADELYRLAQELDGKNSN